MPKAISDISSHLPFASEPGESSESGGLGESDKPNSTDRSNSDKAPTRLAIDALSSIPKKGRAPKTGYSRKEFGNGWSSVQGCTTRNIILNRDLKNVVINDKCQVVSGILNDPYSGKIIEFSKDSGADVQIDHVIALSDAWQKGAQNLTKDDRIKLANDPLELLAVAGADNQQKGDADAATWLPKNKSFRCTYVARQIAIKIKYSLWVTGAEYEAMTGVLNDCKDQRLPV